MKTIRRRDFLAWSAALACGSTWAGRAAAASAEKGSSRPPNIIVILADDLGAKELSCYGHRVHRTPNLDQLAETGVRFETCYATPLCHPTRFMLMTGQYGCHNGIYNFAGRRGGPVPNSPVEDIGKNHITFAEVLKEAGYATALGGKWQLSGELPDLIHDCGFDEYCMWAYDHNLPKGTKYEGGREKEGGKTSRYWHPSIVKNGEYVPTKPEDYGPDMHLDFLIDFASRNKERPFFLYWSSCLTHAPHERTPDTVNSKDPDVDKPARRFQGALEYLDKQVGRLVKALDDLGLRENTLIFFTGDNGTGGDGKGTPTELGARVPMIVSAPGIVKPRPATKELTDLTDILPTIAEFAGADLPKDRVIDGKSYADFLRGQTDHTRDWIFSFLGDYRILRTQRWLLENNTPHQWGQLYDCGDCRDGTAYKDVTDSKEPEVLAVRKEFEALLEKLPAPDLPVEGPANEKKPERAERKKRRSKKKDKE